MEKIEDAYTVTFVSPWLRFTYAITVLSFSWLIGIGWLKRLHDFGDWPHYLWGVLPVILIAGGTNWAWGIATKKLRKDFSTYPSEIPWPKRRKRVVIASALLGFVIWFIAAGSNDVLADPLGTAAIAGIYIIALGFYIIRQIVVKSEPLLTRAALEEKARKQVEWQQKGFSAEPSRFDNLTTELWRFWWIRYATGAALLAIAIWIVDNPTNKGWPVAVLILLLGLACMKELAGWLLGLGIVIGFASMIVGLLGALPLSAAIIIGALILAGSTRK